MFWFFILKQKLGIMSFDCIIYHCTPPRSFSIYLYSGSTSIVKLWIIPDYLPFKNLLWAILHSKNILSNDRIPTGLGEKLYSSYIVILLNPSRSTILSLCTNVITGPWVDLSIIDPSVEKFGFV